MASIGLGTSVAQARNRNSTPTTSLLTNMARVVDVILDSSHTKYGDHHEALSINGVFYRRIDTQGTEDPTADVNFAYQGNMSNKTVPLVGEIVRLMDGPSEIGGQGTGANKPKQYWMEIIPVWNSPQDNVSTTDQYEDQAFGDVFQDTGDVNPLQAAPGDVFTVGRYGNSIRFGGSTIKDGEIITDDNNGKGVIFISNGRERGDGMTSVLEDINLDAASIYLVEDHVVPLEQANEKRDAWEEEPEKADVYQGKQVIVNSGRLYFNAYEESVLFSAIESVSGNANTISFDGVEYVGLDAGKIYLGTAAFKEEQPVLRGQISTDWMEDFLKQFEQVVKALATLPPAPPAAIAKLIATGNAIMPIITPLKQQLPNLHSAKTFTE